VTVVIFLYMLSGAVVAIVIGYLVNQLPRIKRKSGMTHWMIIAALAVLGLGSGFIAYRLWKVQAAADPIAAISAPADGSKISRILGVGVDVTRRPAEDHSLWLGYQNEAGGPLMIQAQKCAVFQKSADCGPLHVGHDEYDKSAFKLFLFDADEDATSFLENKGDETGGGPGANMALDEWPTGTEIISMVHNVSLRQE
jgi:hypothetical protein